MSGYAHAPDKQSELDILRHSAAHLLAAAVIELYPDTKYAIGPPVENGFYYDFEFPCKISDHDLEAIEQRMREKVAQALPYVREEVSREDAIKLFSSLGQDYKVEILNEIEDPIVSIYRTGEFVDLCRGPHVSDTSQIKAFKLLKIAGAYWRGISSNKMLQRIYGTAWFTEQELQEYLDLLARAAERDHRKIGRELGLYLIDEHVGQGLPIWLPKGAMIRNILQDYVKKLEEDLGYQYVYTPPVADEELYRTSGHLDLFSESMFPAISFEDGGSLRLRPMNCPHHIAIYASELRSYRDLPLKIAEFGTVFRYEKSGELSGLMRARTFTQNDAHIFCTIDQLEEVIRETIVLTLRVFEDLGIDDFKLRLSLHDDKKDKWFPDELLWQKAEDSLRSALSSSPFGYFEAQGEAAFYGPKIDFQVRDIMAREYTLSTIQVDFYLPQRFSLSYVGPDGHKRTPVMVHRAPLGSLERMLAFLIEMYSGAFPLWLAPIQVAVLPISDLIIDYASDIARRLKQNGIRVTVVDKKGTIQAKVRQAQLEKIPYMLVVGRKEVQENVVSVRHRSRGEIGNMRLEAFLTMLLDEIDKKSRL